MNLTITINGTDRTSRVNFPNLTKIDHINHNKDRVRFTVKQLSTEAWKPKIDDEIIITDGGTRIFGGAITSVTRKATIVNRVEYSVECLDYSFYLDRALVLERFRSRSISYIIDFILTKYDTEGFTMTNVKGDTVIGSMSFNRITISECIQKLAEAIGFSWYVDYNKDIHFFPKNTNPAPFNLTDTSNNFIWESLEVSDNLDQIRNAVFVEGGEERGNERSEDFTASGDIESRRYYRLANKFAETPTVTVNGTEVTVGTEFLSEDTAFDCMWNFNEKYIRFTDGNVPVATDSIEVTGIPLFPVVVRVQDPSSIDTYGLWEFVIRDNSVQSRDEALERARAELASYARGVVECEFNTYTPGLRSGQVISINSPIRGVDESFLVQQVTMQTRTQDHAEYKVRLATLRTISLVELLQGMLKEKGIREGETETLLTFLDFTDSGAGEDNAPTFSKSTGPYLITDSAGNVTSGTKLIINYGTVTAA